MSTKIMELREKQQKIVADARECLNQIDEADEARAKELNEQHDKLMADYDKLEGQIERLAKTEEREKAFKTEGPTNPGGKPEGEQRSYDDAFREYLKRGRNEMSAEDRQILAEYRAQSTAATEGAELVPEGFVAELIKSMAAFGPMLDPGVTRQIVTASGNALPWPTMNDTTNKGAILAENTQDTELDVAFGQKQLDAFKYTSKIIRVSEELLQDDAVGIEAIIRDAMAERLGRIVNEHLTTGTGSGQPNGIVTASTLGATAAAGAAISFNDVLDLLHSVDPAYRRDPSTGFQFSDATLKELRKVTDSNGNFIWQPADVRTGEPSTLLGEPYFINQDMADIGLSAKSMIYGAMNRYIVRRVREFAVRRLVERYADFYQVGFLGFGRFDGELVDAAAVKHLAHPAA